MVTKLTKPVSRRVGDTIITITKDGIEVRQHNARRSGKVSIEQLQDLACRPKNRTEAFERPSPSGWVPDRGERVYVRRGKRATEVVTAIVQAVPLCATVGISGRVVEVDDLRPCSTVAKGKKP